MQLGPVLASSQAGELGLEQSLLERMMKRDMYQRDSKTFRDHGGYNPLLVSLDIPIFHNINQVPLAFIDLKVNPIQRKMIVLPFATDPKVLKSMVSFLIKFFFFTVFF